MNIKIQNKSPFSGDNNSGSCKGYVKYLQHEKEDKQKAGILGEEIPFFDAFGDEADETSVIECIDKNKRQLHKADTKYYSNIISFSDEEISLMGNTREQRLESVHTMVVKMMDAYARNFNRDGVRSREDLLYYYTIHEYRGSAGTLRPGLHVHMIISRKDRSNTYKLSPMTNHRKGSSGVIKHGFHRNDYYRECERIFDEHFKHERSVEQSFDYCNAMKNGTEQERAEQIRRYVGQLNLEVLVAEERMFRWKRFAQEAESRVSYEGKTPQEMERIRMNLFWNSYHTHYKPIVDSLKEGCQEAFTLYDRAKSAGALNSSCLDTEVRKLRSCYAQIEHLTQELSKAKTSKRFLAVFSLLISVINPVPAILLMVIGGLVLGLQRRLTFNSRNTLYKKASAISDNVKVLQAKQEALRYSKNDALRKYISVKEQREELKSELNTVKEILSETEASLGIDPAKDGWREHYSTIPLAQDIQLAQWVISIFRSTRDRWNTDKELYYRGLVCRPIMHPNGGVADLQFIRGKESITGQNLLTCYYAPEILDRWCELTGHTPADKVKTNEGVSHQQNNTKKHGPRL